MSDQSWADLISDQLAVAKKIKKNAWHERPTFKKTITQVRAITLMCTVAIHLLLYGGSRSGKTFIIIYAIICRALKEPSRHLIARFRFNSLKRSIWYDTFPKVMATAFPKVKHWKNSQDWFIRFPNGSEIWFGGLDDKERVERILGNEYSTIFLNEISEMSYSSVMTVLTRLAQKTKLVNKVYYDCNPPSKSHWGYKLFFEHIDPETKEAKPNPQHYAEMRMNPDGNRENIADNYIEDILMSLPGRRRKRFLEGEWLDDAEGGLWKREWINATRVTNCPPLKRIVIAVDPAVTNTMNSNEHGIIAGGIGYDDHVYVFADHSLKASPSQWATLVSTRYNEYQADKVVGEVNNGGDLVEMNLRTVNPLINYKSVRASRGKAVRAEPVSGMYELGKVHHVGVLDILEDQMCNFDPMVERDDNESPDRMDALVWLVYELLGIEEPTKRAGTWGTPIKEN